MSENEYTISDIANQRVDYKVVDGVLYCAGVRVERWQMTEAEQKQYFPQEFYRENMREDYVPTYDGICPVDGCPQEVMTNNKTSLMRHIMHKHKELFKSNKTKLVRTKSYEELNDAAAKLQAKSNKADGPVESVEEETRNGNEEGQE